MRCSAWNGKVQLFQHILCRFHQLGALPYQGMASARLGCMDGARNGKYFTPLLHRQPGRDQRAGCQCGLHYQCALRQSRNDAVAFGEIGRQGRCAEGVFADQDAVGGNAPRKSQVLTGVHPVKSRAHHGNRGGSVDMGQRAVQGSFVCGGVHAQCQPGHDGQTGCMQCTRKLARVVRALGGGVAAAHDGQATPGGKRIGRPHC